MQKAEIWISYFFAAAIDHWISAIQCEAIRSEQFENGLFSSSKQKITFASHEYGQVRVFRISSEVIARRKVSIFQLFPSDCITL